MRDLRERLSNILEAIGHFERYAVRGLEAFDDDDLIQNLQTAPRVVTRRAANASPH